MRTKENEESEKSEETYVEKKNTTAQCPPVFLT
jgi:hypothetical protein